MGKSNTKSKLAVFIKSEMLREERENCFCKYQRYPITTIESQNKTIMAGVPLADFTTVLQRCHAVLNVTGYIFSFGVSLCC